MPAYHHTAEGPQPCHIIETYNVYNGQQVDIAAAPNEPPYALRVPVSADPTPGHVTIVESDSEPEPQPKPKRKARPLTPPL